jgi:hypothetical protein
MHRFEQVKPHILAARTEEDLVQTMRHFCGMFERSELSVLPAECAHCDVTSPEDIAELAVAMKTCQVRYADPAMAGSLEVLSRAFTLASEQLQRLRPFRP